MASSDFGLPLDLADLVRAALAEDVGAGDVTTAATVTGDRAGRARVIGGVLDIGSVERDPVPVELQGFSVE